MCKSVFQGLKCRLYFIQMDLTNFFHSCHPSDQMYTRMSNMDCDLEYSRFLRYDKGWHNILCLFDMWIPQKAMDTNNKNTGKLTVYNNVLRYNIG